MTQNIDLNNLDKSTWETFKFEDIAEKISKTVKPDEAKVDIYIGLEHIDANDIHIRRQGVPADVKGGKLRCFPGDVIFGKRRAYQRKAAIVTFDGICSAHAFVFRTNEEIIDPKLFIFFLHSDQFMHRMVDISVGGLSPTINWGDLKQQEFLLPPKDQQAKLAELLWAMDEVIERENQFLENIELLKKVELKKAFKSKDKEVNLLNLKEVCKITSGGTAPQGDEFFLDGTFPFVRMQHLNNLEGDKYPTNYDYVNSKAVEEKRLKKIEKGSILLAKSGESIRSEKKAILKIDSYVVNHLAILNEYKSFVKKDYLFYFFQDFKLSSLISQTTTPSISLSDLGRIKIPIYKIEKQEFYIDRFKHLDSSKSAIKSKISSSKALQKSLINQVF